MQPASGQMCFNRVDGHSGDARNFFQTLFFHIKKQDGCSLFGIEFIHGHIQRLMFKGFIRLFGSGDRQAFHFDWAVAFCRFIRIAEAIVSNPEQPSGEGRPTSKRFQMQKGLDEGLLGDVVG